MELLKVENLKKYYEIKKGKFGQKAILKAVDDVSFIVHRGETLSIVGESGCGKSTTGKLILKIEEPTSGKILFKGEDVTKKDRQELKEYRKSVQIIFQDPYSSLNPRWRVGDIIAEPLKLNTNLSNKEIEEKVYFLMEKVGLLKEHYYRYPHQFSGGQRQRIGIARALTLNPELIVCDEPVSALDVSIQSQVLNLLLDLQEEFKLTYLFISHDLSVVRHISDRIIVMYLGKIMEKGTVDDIFNSPMHPYTQALLESVPEIGKEKEKKMVLTGEIPSPINPPSGCRFRTRCPYAKSECAEISGDLISISDTHETACPFRI
ncbi:dipeptide ABC transporter ATP-binding protein [Deferribacter autotrophicus]|uniref:Dipeptide ABC transporter ATP-binding protein n=1 Tax=Deferribacter autotrophicus TaxID=500465 RepID=A0A5A8F508_9BACT|nr:dipeptide ABC transporter ATP-binding protein [Deferribacter autotrophicus]KAA0258576.1 dipeptide ABC transporter ATP-binding protein [Deferribacter autotrophicus]